MKNLLLIALAAMAFVACTDKNDEFGAGGGKITFAGESYPIGVAYQIYDGISQVEYSSDITLSLFAEESDLYLTMNMYVPVSNDRLVQGTYSFADTYTYDPLTFTSGYVVVGDWIYGNYEDYANISGGTVDVTVSGENYTLRFNLTTEDDRTVTGTYKGKTKNINPMER